MASVNKVILLGNLGRDPEARTYPSGDPVTTMSVATTNRWRDRATGQEREATEWHRVVATGQAADFAAKYLTKGSQIYIEGYLKSRKWQDTKGIDREGVEIRVDVITPVGGRRDGEDG